MSKKVAKPAKPPKFGKPASCSTGDADGDAMMDKKVAKPAKKKKGGK